MILKDVRTDFTREVTPGRVREFYRDHPFPWYDPAEFATFEDLNRRASNFVRLLHQSLPSKCTILDAGCGTGQHSVFLSQAPGRKITSIDFSQQSLTHAIGLANHFGCDNISFECRDIFSLSSSDLRFDVVVSLGVLHHTANPAEAFRIVSERVAERGFLVVGLYHRFGRRGLWKEAGFIQNGKAKSVPEGRFYRTDELTGTARSSNWYENMYQHPGESGHTFVEVAGWVRDAGFELVCSLPDSRWRIDVIPSLSDHASINRTSRFRFALMDARMLFNPVENGYFVMIGKRKR